VDWWGWVDPWTMFYNVDGNEILADVSANLQFSPPFVFLCASLKMQACYTTPNNNLLVRSLPNAIGL
jgi:hypothetical protein